MISKELNIDAIEIRNDIKTNIINENEPSKLKNKCLEKSLKILSINALQKFNIWNKERENEFISLCKYADQADIKAIVLRIDSGGGSALASDQMWREVLKTTTEDSTNIKPFGIMHQNPNGHQFIRYLGKCFTFPASSRLYLIKSILIHFLSAKTTRNSDHTYKPKPYPVQEQELRQEPPFQVVVLSKA